MVQDDRAGSEKTAGSSGHLPIELGGDLGVGRRFIEPWHQRSSLPCGTTGSTRLVVESPSCGIPGHFQRSVIRSWSSWSRRQGVDHSYSSGCWSCRSSDFCCEPFDARSSLERFAAGTSRPSPVTPFLSPPTDDRAFQVMTALLVLTDCRKSGERIPASSPRNPPSSAPTLPTPRSRRTQRPCESRNDAGTRESHCRGRPPPGSSGSPPADTSVSKRRIPRRSGPGIVGGRVDGRVSIIAAGTAGGSPVGRRIRA